MIPRPRAAPYHRVVKTVAARLARLPQPLAARLAALPPRRQELVQDTGARRRAGHGQRGLAAAVPGPAAPAVAGPVARRRPGPPARLAPVQARGDRPGHRGRAGRLRQDRVRVRAVPARAGDRVLHDHRPSRTDLALDRLPAGGGGHRGLGGLARPRPAIRHHLPGDDLPHRRGGGPAQPGQAGQHPGGAEPGRPRRGGSSTVNRRRPRSGSGPGSPASCTTWWRTTSA